MEVMTLVKTSTGGLVGIGSNGGTLQHTERKSDAIYYQRAVLVERSGMKCCDLLSESGVGGKIRYEVMSAIIEGLDIYRIRM